MGNVVVSPSVSARGPLFEGDLAHTIIVDWLDEVKKDIAQEGVNRLRSFTMDKTGRGTGHYQAEIITSDLSNHDLRIHDPLVYGPWLNGSSERNQTTRFKGYKLWRKTRESLDADAPQIAEEHMPDLIQRLGGVP